MSKPTLRQSTLGTLEICAYQIECYERYGPCPPGVAMVRGTSAHLSAFLDLSSKQKEGELMPDEAIADLAADSFEAIWDGNEGVRLSEDERELGEKKVKDATKDTVIKMAETHHAELAPEIDPVHLEEPFLVEIDDFPYDLSGTIDVVETKGLRDLKTKTKTPPESVAQKSVQGVHYSLCRKVLTGEAPEYFKLDHLVALKGGTKVVTREATYTDADYDAHLLRLEQAASVLQSGALMPCPPESWACSSKWCGWFDKCAFGARGRSR